MSYLSRLIGVSRNDVTLLLRRLKALGRSGCTPHKLFEGTSDDFWIWAHTNGYRKHRALRAILPSSPDEAIQSRFTGLSGDDTLRDGFKTYKVVKEVVDTYLGGLSRCERVLDFGCGWGRIIRFFLRDLSPEKILGVDCMPEAVALCQAHNHWCRFQKIETMPPSGLEAGSFDFIYAFSVFSHLSERAHRLWLEEFHRLLKPGGLVILTTRAREFIPGCEFFNGRSNLAAFTPDEPAIAESTSRWLTAYDHGEFSCDGLGITRR
jgi:SAM-dependent methyltransferase